MSCEALRSEDPDRGSESPHKNPAFGSGVRYRAVRSSSRDLMIRGIRSEVAHVLRTVPRSLSDVPIDLSEVRLQSLTQAISDRLPMLEAAFILNLEAPFHSIGLNVGRSTSDSGAHDCFLQLRYIPPSWLVRMIDDDFYWMILATEDDDQCVIEVLLNRSTTDKDGASESELVRSAPESHMLQVLLVGQILQLFRTLVGFAPAGGGRRGALTQSRRLGSALLAEPRKHASSEIAERQLSELLLPLHLYLSQSDSQSHIASGLGCIEYATLALYVRRGILSDNAGSQRNHIHLKASSLSALAKSLLEGSYAANDELGISVTAYDLKEMTDTTISEAAKQDSQLGSEMIIYGLDSDLVEPNPDSDNSSGSGESCSSESTMEDASASEDEDILSDWVLDKKQMAIDAIMRSFCAWLDSKLAPIRRAAAGQGDGLGDGGGVSISTLEHNSSVGAQGSSHRRNLKRKQMDGFEDDDPERGPGRDSGIGETGLGGGSRRFACPYFKRDPRKYCRETTCVGPGWVEIHRVKNHLYRRHSLPVQCPRCWQCFKTEGLRDAHLQMDPPCQTRQNDTVLDGFTKDQEKRLRSRKKSEMNRTNEGKWREMYRILFPDDSTIPDPYHEDVRVAPSADAPGSHSPADFAAFVRREYPRFVRRELEALFETEFQDLNERVRPRIQDMMLNLQPRLIALLQQSTSSAREEEDEPSGSVRLELTTRDDQEPEGVQSAELPFIPASSLPPAFTVAEEMSFTSWAPDLDANPAAFDLNIDWDLLSPDLSNFQIPSHFAMPQQQDISRRDALQGGARQLISTPEEGGLIRA